MIEKLLAENQSCERKRLDEGVDFRVGTALHTFYSSVHQTFCFVLFCFVLFVDAVAVFWMAAVASNEIVQFFMSSSFSTRGAR